MKIEKEDENSWRTKLEEAQLNDDKWTVKVVVIEAGGNPEEVTYLNKFENFASEERRFVIRNICETETMFMVNQLGHEKKIKDDYSKVFEIGQSFLQNKEDIPSDFLALIIKYQMLKIKEDHIFIRRQRLEVEEGLRRDSRTMLDKEEFRGHQKKEDPPEPDPSLPKGKGKIEELTPPEPNPEKKYNTILRERGEEWRDRIYVDDFPTDGPNLYLAVTGFMDPFLPVAMLRIGIPVVAVVQIRINVQKENIPSSLIRPVKKGQSQTHCLPAKFQTFWKELQTLRLNVETCDDLKDTAFILFKPPYFSDDPLSGDSEKIYDEISYLMYDVQDLSRQHLHYLDNMAILGIPEEDVDERYFNAYNRLICYLPLECVTMYSILDSILQVVSQGEFIPDGSSTLFPTTKVPAPTKKILLSSSKKTMEDVNVTEAVDLVTNIFDKLCMTDADKKTYRITYGEEFENHTDPTVINYGDFVKYPTFHLCNLNLDDIVGQCLFGMPLHKLWLLQDLPQGVLDAKVSFHVNMLLTSFDREDIETAELNRLIHILACRKLYNNRSSLKKAFISPTSITEFKEVYLKRSIFSHPLVQTSLQNSLLESRPISFPSMTEMGNTSSPYYVDSCNSEEDHIRWLLDCPDIKELVSAAEIANNQPISHNLIEEFEFFEDFHGTCAAQILFDAFNKFNCVDYKYCEVTDCIILMFFNSHNKDGINREEWRCHVPTRVCLQDFFDFVLDEHYDWIANEEYIYDESMKKQKCSSTSVVLEFIPPVSCVDDTNVGTDLLMEGSLKHATMLEEFEKAEAETEMMSTATSPKKKGGSSSTIIKGYKIKAGLDKKLIIPSSQWDTTDTENPEIKPFFGYDISDRRVELFGKDALFFSRDRTKVSSLYTLFIPYNVEYIVLSVVPGDGPNEFWVHRALGDFITPEIMTKCEGFRINTKNQVMINIKKECYEVPLPTQNFSHSDVIPPAENNVKTSLSQEVEFEKKSYYGLTITWPNGLIIQSVYEKNSFNISHIKQYRLSPLPHLDEDCRCVTLNGEILIFKTSGDVVVLKPDGTYILIDKYEKRVIVPIIPESEVVQDKGKKGKNKEVKGNKKDIDSHMQEEEKPPEYELYIERFEVIEPSGLRQRWIGDIGYYIENLLVRTATDYCLGETFIRRMDGTYTLLNKDGLQIVTFPDKSKIITSFVIDEEEVYPEWMEGELEFLEPFVDTNTYRSKVSVKSPTASVTASTVLEEDGVKKEESRTDGYISVHLVYTVEHVNFATVTIDRGSEEVSISSPNDTTVTIDPDNNYSFKLDKVGQTCGHFNGETLHINYEACSECKSHTTCDIEFETIEENLEGVHKTWVKLKDSFCQKITVNNEGNINILDEPCSNESDESNVENRSQIVITQDDSKSEDKIEGSLSSIHGKCRELYQAKNLKFIVMNRDLTCSELVHRSLLENYKKECRWKPWCSMNTFNTFGDYRRLHSILMPIRLTEPEKFLMNSITSDKPVNLTYKDLLSTESKKGFYHWMRPYERFEPKSKMIEADVTHKMPKGFVLRTLEQQWTEDKREELKGAKELIRAVLRYRRQLESESETLQHVPIIDLRSEEKKQTSDILQAVAHRMYENLKSDLEEDFQKRATPSITTTPLPVSEMNVEGEQEEEPDLDKYLIDERESQLAALETAAKIDDPVAKYWKIRAEAVKEEEFYLYLLREGKVPKYFLNVVGGACWWEINNLTDEAITLAQRRKMACVCDASSSGTEDDTNNPQPGKSDDTTIPQIVYL